MASGIDDGFSSLDRDNEGLLTKEQMKKFRGNSQWSGWSVFGMTLAGLIIFGALVLGVIGFGMVASQWDGIKTINQCNTEKVDTSILTERVYDTQRTDWPSWSKTLQSTRYNPHVNDKGKLKNWKSICAAGTEAYLVLNANAGVSSTATTDYELNMLFVPTWGYKNGTGARLYGIDASNCVVVWSVLVSDIAQQTVTVGNDPTGVVNPTATVRTSLTVYQNRTGGTNLIFGDLGTSRYLNLSVCQNVTTCGARIYSIEAATGQLLWRSLVSGDAVAGYVRQSDAITSSPTIVGDSAIFGVSSYQSADVAFTGELNFFGRYFSIDGNDGNILWIETTNSVDRIIEGNYGSAVWGSSPPYDYNTGQIFFGTGNLYNYSSSVAACLAAGNTRKQCLQPGIINDSVFGVKIWFGASILRPWTYSPIGADAWNVACRGIGNTANCPANSGPDYDFGTGGIIIQNECGQRFLIMLNKGGFLVSIDVDTGDISWIRYLGGGSYLVPSWGNSFDGENIYLPIGNSEKRSYLTLDGTLRCDSFWTAINAWTGEIKWLQPTPCSRASSECPSQTPYYDTNLTGVVPEEQLTFADRPPQKAGAALSCYGSVSDDYRNDPALASTNSGGVITTKNYLYGGAWSGYMHAFHKDSGSIAYTFPRCSSGIIYGSPSISVLQDVQLLTWGCGYYTIAGVDSEGGDQLMMIDL